MQGINLAYTLKPEIPKVGHLWQDRFNEFVSTPGYREEQDLRRRMEGGVAGEADRRPFERAFTPHAGPAA